MDTPLCRIELFGRLHMVVRQGPQERTITRFHLQKIAALLAYSL